MGQPFVGEIRMFAGNFAPVGWALCQGQLVPISENEPLFQLIGTTYGGDGQSTFALPNLQSRVPLHMGTGPGLSTYPIGQFGGAESVTLTVQQIPSHTHVMQATNTGQVQKPTANTSPAVATSTPPNAHIYGPPPGAATLLGQTISAIGGNQPHDNMKPFLVLNFIISLFGVFPSQT
jgi:microcystin-dependent protein